LEVRLRKGVEVLGARYDVRVSSHVLGRDGYFAGDDATRARAMSDALADPQIRAIVCAGGGYGAMRILSALDAAAFARAPKPIIGFSDITALHAWCARADVASIHGPNVGLIGGLDGSHAAALFRLLDGEIGSSMPGRSIGLRAIAEGPLLGGNLEVVRSLLATPWAFDFDGAVLLIEEVGERPYRIDRSLTQLRLAGALDRVAAIVVGDLTRCDEPEGVGPTAHEVIVERLSTLGVPVLVDLPVGHADVNLPLALGRRVRVDGVLGALVPLEAAAA